MAERTIRTGIGTYLGTDGVWNYAHFGAVVDVADEDLERFDRLNPTERDVAAATADDDAFPEGDPTEDWTVPQLKAYAREHAIDFASDGVKADIYGAVSAAVVAEKEAAEQAAADEAAAAREAAKTSKK